jgi:hypothetical protein
MADASRTDEVQPFAGVRVIDMTHVLAGPFATYQLAVFGADVIKIENPGDPDQTRLDGADPALSAARIGTHFIVQNAAKRSMTLDLKTEAGRDVPAPAGSDRGHPGRELPPRGEHYGETIPGLDLAGVVGRRCRDLTDEEAKSALFGYSIVNDVTSHGMKLGMDAVATTREPRPGAHGRGGLVCLARAKATDTFGPMGPWITTADEVSDPNDLKVAGWLDGEPFAVDSTARYRFRIQRVVAEASRYFTLEPGDVICFGTSATGCGQVPRRPPLGESPPALRRHGHRHRGPRAADQLDPARLEGLNARRPDHPPRRP